jgi:type II secretory ATPase GspE/PulE/Tfp pilus assembly ATPase PilB-like protein
MDKVQFETAKKTAEASSQQVRGGADEKMVVQDVDQVIQDAISEGANEIHFEPHAEGLTIRTRNRGFLKTVKEIPDKTKSNVINRIKVISGMDITRNRLPQSGFFKITVGEKKIELYSYIMPSLYGEALVIKVQYKQSATLRLDQLGLVQNMLAAFKKALAKGSGLYLVTGPPGSGKRTTVYAAILEVLQPHLSAMAFDPVVKYEIPGMVQGKPEDKSEFTFADGIAALMRQEPDVAFIGDITCQEEARAAIQGAFAKRVVLCRMTANDTINAMQNITDMGIQPFLVAASLACVLNQRLLRRLCTTCREPYAVTETLQKELGFRLPDGAKFFKAKGCPACENTGYSGVVAIFEIFIPTEEFNKLVVAKAPVQALRQQAAKEGAVSLKMDGLMKAMAGMATLEDVLNSL